MCKLPSTVCVLALLISSLSPSAHAQDKQRHVYSVKYVCGTHETDLNNTGSVVAAGGYRTEVNIQRAQIAGEARIEVLPGLAHSVFSEDPGVTGRTHVTTLVGAEVARVICQDINGLIDDRIGNQFRVGFLRIASFEPLSVVAVYTAKHCRTTAASSCDGDIALDVVRYDPALVEPIKDDSKSPTIPF
jgi:hypothetical protein